ncbi:AAA family ATPase [Thauera humireducens]|uniref:nucleotide-binding protein n=1 Tax=Thauera humireducens TaxID=1134435 RepID=UPI00311F0C2D
MKKKLIIVGGSKGGVGKSIVSTAVIDLLRQRGEKLLVIDSDTSNPDVFKSHHKTLECLTLDLDRKDGWMALLNAAYNTDATVVINSAARNNQAVDNFGSLLMSALSELDRALTTLWVINRQRDSLLLLRQYRQTIKGNARRAEPSRRRTDAVRTVQRLEAAG